MAAVDVDPVLTPEGQVDGQKPPEVSSNKRPSDTDEPNCKKLKTEEDEVIIRKIC